MVYATCPNCGGHEIKKMPSRLFLALAVLTLAAIPVERVLPVFPYVAALHAHPFVNLIQATPQQQQTEHNPDEERGIDMA